ncbi:MAG: helix-turn-helix domain-containing protein [Ignavibacteriales bacterium]|nr:helix-turn-helix domain-containing protein [Ignavibacteriales bacterium]
MHQGNYPNPFLILTQSLDDNDWNQSQAARMLEIPEQTLRYKMKKLGLFRIK